MADRAEHHVTCITKEVHVCGNNNTVVGNVVTDNVTIIVVNKPPEEPRTASNLPSNIEDASLREYYIDSLCLAAPLPSHPDYTWDIAEIYTDLVIEKSEEQLPLENLFEHAKNQSRGKFFRILIEGNAGYGKSTLTLKLASDWAKRNTHERYNYLKPFGLLFVAQLGRVEESGDLLNHLKSIYDEKINVLFEEVLKGNDDLQVLIVLDGYDEAKDATKKTVGRIMEKALWSKSHVIVTSRFGHVPQPIKGKNFCVTVKGYGTKQVAVAVGKFFIKSGQLTKENAVLYSPGETTGKDFESIDDSSSIVRKKQPFTEEHFQTFLRNVCFESPFKDLAQCPLLCAMMCCLIGEFPNYKLPETLSELYFATINRNLCREDAKDSIAVGDDCYEYDWDFYNRNFDEDHHGYLYKFGFLCLEGLMKNDMLFSLFQLTGEKKVKPSDPRILQLVKAGVVIKSVVIKSFGEPVNTMYQVPHRTMAEFLAAYYLAKEKDTRKAESHLLKLCAKKASFGSLSALCFELDSGTIVVDAFREVKLNEHLLDVIRKKLPIDAESFVKEIAPALSCSLRLAGSNPHLFRVTKYHPNLRFLVIDSWDISKQAHESLMELMAMDLNLTLYGSLRSIGYTALLNENSTHPSFIFEAAHHENLKLLLEWLRLFVDHKIQLHTVNLSVHYLGAALDEDFLVGLKLLLQSDSCPKAISIEIKDEQDLQNLCDAFETLRGNCMLERLHLKKQSTTRNPGLLEKVVKVLLKRCKNLSLSLKFNVFHSWMNERDFWNILVSNLEELTLENLTLKFESAQEKKNNVSAGYKLKKLTLNNVKPHFPDTFASNLDTTLFALDTLEVVNCEWSMLKWLASVCSLRQLKLYGLKSEGNSVDVLQAFDCFSSESAKTLELLDLRVRSLTENEIDLIQDGISCFPRLEGVELHIRFNDASESRACKILNIQSLKSLAYNSYEDPFFNALKGLAYKWPGKDGLAPGQTDSTLALKLLRRPNAAKMILFFRERDIDFRIKEIGKKTYEIWFPPKSLHPKQSDKIDASPNGSLEPKVEKKV